MKLGMGTAQFGSSYGISNKKGDLSDTQVKGLLTGALENHIEILDTASAYGNSEIRLGQILPLHHKFKIVTKGNTADLVNSFYRSLERLNQSKIYGFLIHDAENLTRHGGTNLFNKLRELQDRGLVEKIGVSVYDGAQIDRVLELSPVDIVQLPVNILDQRLIKSGYLKKLKKEGVEIHARSAFLQGLLLMAPKDLPSQFESIREHLTALRNMAKEKNLTMVQLALGFVNCLPEVDKVIVGMTSSSELSEIVSSFEFPDSYVEAISTIAETAAWESKKILDPSLWGKID